MRLSHDLDCGIWCSKSSSIYFELKQEVGCAQLIFSMYYLFLSYLLCFIVVYLYYYSDCGESCSSHRRFTFNKFYLSSVVNEQVLCHIPIISCSLQFQLWALSSWSSLFFVTPFCACYVDWASTWTCCSNYTNKHLRSNQPYPIQG